MASTGGREESGRKTAPEAENGPDTGFRACRRNFVKALAQAGADSPELDARLLISHALHLSGAGYFMMADRNLSPAELRDIAVLLARRLAGEPVSRILGSRSFWKHEFSLSAATLDPRPDSETIVETALSIVENDHIFSKKQKDSLRILDLGTGSGALLVSLLLELPKATGVGIDISRQALETARQNAERLGCADRADFCRHDWLDGFLSKGCRAGAGFDLVVCNPPYIPAQEIAALGREVRDFDPRRALDGGPDGLDCYRKIIPSLDMVMNNMGVAVFEFGNGQHDAVKRLFLEAGFGVVGADDGFFPDLSGVIRCIAVTGKTQ